MDGSIDTKMPAHSLAHSVSRTADKKPNRSAAYRILRAIGLVFFTGWLAVAILLLCMRVSWQEFAGSVLLFGGFFLSWVLAIIVLKHKDPKLVEGLLDEISEDEGKQQEDSVCDKSDQA